MLRNTKKPPGKEKKSIAFTRDEKTDLPNVKGEVKRAIKATFAHLCTSLTRDKCLPLPAVKGESSGDKGRFCHAFNPYLWRRYISLAFEPYQRCRQICLRFRPKVWQKRGKVMSVIKVKGSWKVSSNVSEPQVKCVTKLLSNASEI